MVISFRAQWTLCGTLCDRGASRTRTGDPLLAKQMRYQLRYSPMELNLSDGRSLPAVPWTTSSAADHRRSRQLRGQDSNLRPQGYEPCELPNCYHPARADDRARSDDLCFTRASLYQLSYVGGACS